MARGSAVRAATAPSWRSALVVALLASSKALVAPARRRKTATRPNAIRPDDLPKSIVPEAEARATRAAEVREKMKELREYKLQGRRYDGTRDDAAATTPPPGDEAGFSQTMNEGEALFGGGGSILAALEDQARESEARPAAPAKMLRTTEGSGVSSEESTPDEGFASEPKSATSGIGGSWAPPNATTSTHKPKVSTWGVFERPADISKAYGGGKRVGVGAPPAVVNETKQAETAARLARFREKNQADERLVDAHWGEIENATKRAKLLVRRGQSYDAVRTLRPVERWCTAKTRRGSETLLELALAHEAAGDAEAAKKVYAKLVLSPIADVKRRAKQLSFGFEAAEALNVGSYADSEGAKLARGAFELDVARTRRSVDKTYAVGGVAVVGSRAPPLDSRQAVDEALRRATVGRDAFCTTSRAADALRALDRETFGGATTSDDPLVTRLAGEWVVVMEAAANAGGNAEYLPKFDPPLLKVDADGGRVDRVFRKPLLGRVRWTGAVDAALAPDRLAATREDVRPGYAGAFVEPALDLTVLHLQDDVCALREAGTQTLWLLRQRKAG